MLYLRHHPKYLRLNEKGKMFLNEAYGNFGENEISFHKVFNRNGYALYLFRENQVSEAIKLLKEGIKTLSTNKLSEEDNFFHESVLTYNLTQCYIKIGSFENACKYFNRLIEMDPDFQKII